MSILTPTQLPILTPTVVEDFPLPLPSFGEGAPSGRIVFTCYVQQIDQICLMNADGWGVGFFDGEGQGWREDPERVRAFTNDECGVAYPELPSPASDVPPQRGRQEQRG